MANTNPIANLFGKSPFKAIQNHMKIATECASLTPDLFEALAQGDKARLAQVKDKIFELENQADALKNDMRAHLPKSMFLPVDRRDLLEVISVQDSIADVAQDIAGFLTERDMELPVGMRDPVIALTKRCVDVCNHANKVVGELDELVETGFSGRESEKVANMLKELSDIEDDTDRLGMELTQNLFSHEDEMKPVSVVFWYQLIQWIGDLADNAEKTGDRLRLLIASR